MVRRLLHVLRRRFQWKNGFKQYNMRVSPFDAPFPREPAALAAQIFKDVVQGDGKAQRAAELLGQKGI